MKLGTDTGSLVNHMMSMTGDHAIYVGAPATLLSWTDRHPATVVEVITKGKSLYVIVQADSWTRIDNNGISENQSYLYGRDHNGYKSTFKWANSRWRQVVLNEESKRYNLLGVGGLSIGHREKYEDPSF